MAEYLDVRKESCRVAKFVLTGERYEDSYIPWSVSVVNSGILDTDEEVMYVSDSKTEMYGEQPLLEAHRRENVDPDPMELKEVGEEDLAELARSVVEGGDPEQVIERILGEDARDREMPDGTKASRRASRRY